MNTTKRSIISARYLVNHPDAPFKTAMKHVYAYEQEHGEPDPSDPRLISGNKGCRYADDNERDYWYKKRIVIRWEEQHHGAVAEWLAAHRQEVGEQE